MWRLNRRTMRPNPAHTRKAGRGFLRRSTVKPWGDPQGQRARNRGRNQTEGSNRKFRTGWAEFPRQLVVFPIAVCYVGEVQRKQNFEGGGKPRHFSRIKLHSGTQSRQSVGFVAFRGGRKGGGRGGSVRVQNGSGIDSPYFLNIDGRTLFYNPKRHVQSDAFLRIADAFDPASNLHGFFNPNPARATPKGCPSPCFPRSRRAGGQSEPLSASPRRGERQKSHKIPE